MSTERKAKFTDQQLAKIREIIEEHKGMEGALIPTLHKVQEYYGYLPIEVQEMIASGLNLPLAEVYGVVSFYAQFSIQPKGKYSVSVCMGTACYVKGAGKILEKFEDLLGIKAGTTTEDGEFGIEACRCIGACGLAPVVTINGEVYGRLIQDDVKGIVDKYKNQ